MWHGCADELARRFTVVAADLPGYGDSSPSGSGPRSCAALQARAGDRPRAGDGGARATSASRWPGHDRGGRVAYRMALDQPERGHARWRCSTSSRRPRSGRAPDARLALAYWHWGFLAQPAPLPERLIGSRPRRLLRAPRAGGWGSASEPRRLPASRCWTPTVDSCVTRRVVQAICEDYRAGASIDRELDEADRVAANRIECAAARALGQPRGAAAAATTTCSRSGVTGPVTCAAARSTPRTSWSRISRPRSPTG